MMRKTITATSVVFLLLCLPIYSFAQNAIYGSYKPLNTLLQEENLFRVNSIETENRLRNIDFDSLLLEIKEIKNHTVNHFLFRQFYNKPNIDEKKMIRQQWQEAFGIDVWHPYYTAKALEKSVKKRFSVKVFKLKGEPEFERNQVLYTFKVSF